MDLIYLFGFSEMTGKHLERLLPILKAQIKKNHGISFVLIHDGVIGLSKKGKIPKAMSELLDLDITIYALKPDMNARGIPINQLHDKVNTIDYNELVDVLESTQKVISWI
ncbi:MAG: sulfurtransferase complex subunit TusB [Promethearchaeota archaeon]|nr:MAG: sulfurtransferase complex subunit TusB [Candidatus Lokiarchaeota archaeon]